MNDEKNHCIHHVANRCTATICRWKDKHDTMVCSLGGVLGMDHLTDRVREEERRNRRDEH